MELWQLIIIIGTLLACLLSFVWVAIRLRTVAEASKSPKSLTNNSVNTAVSQAFTDDFKEELRARARQHFDAMMQENARFLQQDIRMSAANLDDFMKKEIVVMLQKELAQHNESLNQTQQMVANTITQNKQQFEQGLAQEKERRLKQFDDHMTEVIKNYVLAAVGEVIEPDKQLALVIDNLNAHKAEIYEDIRRGL